MHLEWHSKAQTRFSCQPEECYAQPPKGLVSGSFPQAGSPCQRSWGRCLAHAICSGWGPELLTRAREAFSQAATGNVHCVNLNNPSEANSRAQQNREYNLIIIQGISLRGRNMEIKRSLQNEVIMPPGRQEGSHTK